jgi:LacI family repressor for deo operon, udp, cdd, tsx, nupC, and nupG
MDNERSMATVVSYLVELGHTRIAHLFGPPHRYSSTERSRGYRAALETHGLVYDERYLHMADFAANPDTWRDAIRAVFNQEPRPTAIIAVDDTSAAVAITTLQQDGFRVPEDVSIIGINDHFFASLLNPALTTLRLPVKEAGRLAVEILISRIAGDTTEVKHHLLDLPLIIRDSTGPASV